jgi:hypothetical protein
MVKPRTSTSPSSASPPRTRSAAGAPPHALPAYAFRQPGCTAQPMHPPAEGVVSSGLTPPAAGTRTLTYLTGARAEPTRIRAQTVIDSQKQETRSPAVLAATRYRHAQSPIHNPNTNPFFAPDPPCSAATPRTPTLAHQARHRYSAAPLSALQPSFPADDQWVVVGPVLPAGIACRNQHRELGRFHRRLARPATGFGGSQPRVCGFCHLSTNYQAGLRFSEGVGPILSLGPRSLAWPRRPAGFRVKEFR